MPATVRAGDFVRMSNAVALLAPDFHLPASQTSTSIISQNVVQNTRTSTTTTALARQRRSSCAIVARSLSLSRARVNLTSICPHAMSYVAENPRLMRPRWLTPKTSPLKVRLHSAAGYTTGCTTDWTKCFEYSRSLLLFIRPHAHYYSFRGLCRGICDTIG